MKTLLVVTMVLCAAVSASAQVSAGQLYSVRLADGASLAVVEELGAVVRHVGLSEMVVEGDELVGDALAARGRVATRLPERRATDVLYLSYPRVAVERLSSVGDVVWSERDGAVVVACSPEYADELRSLSFMTYPLPASVDVSSWFDNTPPAHVEGRSSEDERAVRGVVRDVISSISPDSVMAHVLALSEYPGGEPRTRFVYREECLTEAGSYIMSRLDEFLPTRSFVDTQRFFLSGYTCDEGPAGPTVQYPADNIIGVLPGTGRLPGYYIICAHYDAIAGDSEEFPNPVTEPPWFWWCENPAPGADDNATGVATVLEAARALSGISFPFDIRFILLSGEELGLHGSTAYADSVAGYRAGAGLVAPPDTIYGVLNVDMIAYRPEDTVTDSCHIVTNPSTVWFADWIIDTVEPPYSDLFPNFGARRIDKALAYSDHAPFWAHDYDALVAIEHWNPRGRNPYYHTNEDESGTVYPSQLVSITRMVAGAVARLAEPDGQFNLTVFPDDVVFYATTGDGTEYHTDHFVIGQSGPVRVDFHAFGPDGSSDVTLEVWDGSPDEGTLLSTGSFSGVMGGGEVLTHEFEWTPDDDDLGDHLLSVRLVATGALESSLTDNVAEGIPFRIDAPGLFIADHFMWPNPVTDLAELNLSYQLSRESRGSVEIRVFDLLGQDVAKASLFYNPSSTNEGLLSGMNTVGLQTLDMMTMTSLASGVYVYRVTVYDRDAVEPTDQKTGKFAIVR